MPDYKRKKIRKKSTQKKERKQLDNDIVMKPNKRKRSRGIVPENEMKVVRGAKYNRFIRNKFLIYIISFFALIYFLFYLILPVGVYENVVNTTALFGTGKYPIEISGNDIINCVSQGNHYYVLTDTSITAYSNNGKILLNGMHGFSNPILSTSSVRSIVYDQGGKTIYVYNLGGLIKKIETKHEIITASISNDGSIAVATHSDSYESVVSVYDKNFKQIYAWNSAIDIINNVLLNNSGKQLAISTFNATGGQFTSKMMILNITVESADPLHTVDLSNSLVLSMMNVGKGVSIITENSCKFVHWKKFTTNDITSNGQINFVRKGDNGVLLVFNRANDRRDNTIILVSKQGVKSKEFTVNSFINDIQYSKGRVYYINDTNINILDGEGKLLRYGVCDYGAEKFAILSSNTTAVITDTNIIKTDIDKGEN